MLEKGSFVSPLVKILDDSWPVSTGVWTLRVQALLLPSLHHELHEKFIAIWMKVHSCSLPSLRCTREANQVVLSQLGQSHNRVTCRSKTAATLTGIVLGSGAVGLCRVQRHVLRKQV